MPGLGTIVNMIVVIAGGLLGLAFGRFFTEGLQDSLVKACGVSSFLIGVGGVMARMLTVTQGSLDTQGSMMMIISLLIGTLIGALLKIEDGIEHFGEWLKKKTGNSGNARFVEGFLNASLTMCVGAMAVIGSIEDGINADHSILFAKSVLDCIIVIAMTSSMGIGCLFSFVSIALFQGGITLLSRFLQPVMTAAALANLSYVGSAMIMCVGINLIFGKKIRVANMLPGLVIAVIFAFF